LSAVGVPGGHKAPRHLNGWRETRFARALGRFLVRGSLGLALAGAGSLPAAMAPYPPDADTLHLWHLDEPASASSATNAVAGGVALTAIANGASLAHPALPGFGSAASTYDGGPGATLAANPNGVPGRDAYLGPLPFVNGPGDNALLVCAGTNGAFTFEALVRADFGPTNLAVAPDKSRTMQILSADAEETLRLFQFRIVWTRTNDPNPQLQFINIGAAPPGIQTLMAYLPMSGSNALGASNWYHVAVSYDGRPNTAGNLKLYWTRAEPGRTRADLLASQRMTNNLPTGSADWGLGNEGRATGGSDGNWVGLLDEARISSVARGPDEFIFFADTDGDGLPDAWELKHFGSLARGPADDPDGDGFSNWQEYRGGSNPARKASTPGDKDADGLPDVWEITCFGSLAPGPADDPDGDGFTNAEEWAAGTNPADAASSPADTDGDGLPDAWEIAHFGSLDLGPEDDPDDDGFSNRQEYRAGTNPADPHSCPPGPRVRFIPIEDGDPDTSEYAYAGGGINTVSFIRSSLMTVGEQQFITYYGRHQTNPNYSFNNTLWVARRTITTNRWEVFRTSFTANNIADGHDCISMGFDGEGYMHLSWGMHGDAFHYARSTAPVLGNGPIAFGPDGTMTGQETAVTYPQFITLPGGDLLFLFRKGSSGNGDTFLNRYRLIHHSWVNLHTDGVQSRPFIKGTGWTPNYNAYWQMPCLDAAGNLLLVWTWRYNADSPKKEVGYQTNHDFAYARSANGGITWLRSDGTPYALPISESGENGDPNTIAEKVLDIPEGSSLMNQSGMCLDQSGQPVIANWWAPGAATNNHRRQYLVAFPAAAGWETRQLSHRTLDSPAYKVPETALGDMGRPTILCDRDDRLIVIYRDNEGSNGLTVVHSLPRAQDPARQVWTAFDLTTENLGRFDAPNVDLPRWERDNVLHIFYQPVNGLGYAAPANTAAPIGVLEWDAAAYFAHRPFLQVSRSGTADATLAFNAQPGWTYQVQTSTNLSDWDTLATLAGIAGRLQYVHTNGVSASPRFWRLRLHEGSD